MTRAAIIALMVCCSFSVKAKIEGFGLDSTRIIYNESDYSKSIVARNNSEEPMLVVSKVENINGGGENGFYVVPNVVRLEKKSKNPIRVMMKTKSLPKDRERVFYFVSTSIRADALGDLHTNKVPVAVGVKIKLFYRPLGLKGDSGDAAKKLLVERGVNSVTLKNNSAYYVNLAYLEVGKEGIELNADQSMIPPMGKMSYNVKDAKGKIKWVYINDYGSGVKNEYNEH